MQFIEDFKQKVGKWVFQRELKINKRSKAVCNLEDANSIGILYDATSEEQIKIIKPFVSYFFDLKKGVKALGYVNSKQLSFHHTPKLQYDFFYQKDLNWFYKPQNYIIDNFVKKESTSETTLSRIEESLHSIITLNKDSVPDILTKILPSLPSISSEPKK